MDAQPGGINAVAGALGGNPGSVRVRTHQADTGQWSRNYPSSTAVNVAPGGF